MLFKTLQQAQDYLYTFCDEKNTAAQGGKSFSFHRSGYLAKALGNPQNNLTVIHVAGTSGKGSTITMLSHLLQAHELKIGSSVSPHLVDFRERFQINNTFLSVKTLCSSIEEIHPILEKMRTSRVGCPTYFEVSIMLAYYIFWKEGVDYAIMETGMGGRFDATNVVTNPNKIAIITRIGLDHTEFLGETLEKIASEKGAIIHPHNITISIKQSDGVHQVISAQTKKQQSPLHLVIPNQTYSNVTSSIGGNTFDFHYDDVYFDAMTLSIQGEFQVENSSMALTALVVVSKRDGFALNKSAIRSTLSTINAPGRFETVTIKGKTTIVDGAHNPQKMSAFITSLKKLYPNMKFDFLLGFKKGKDYATMLNQIVPLARKVYISEFAKQDQPRVIHPESIVDIKNMIAHINEEVLVESYENPLEALNVAGKDTSQILVITGSLYLISELYPAIRGTL